MRRLLGVLALALAQAGPNYNLDQKERWSAGYADKTWGLKIKSVKCEHFAPDRKGTEEYRVVLEFGKDLKPDELKALRESIDPTTSPAAGGKLEFQGFDDDGVVALRCTVYTLQGELTGTKGDAFRVVIPVRSRAEWAKLTRVEIRQPVQARTAPTAALKLLEETLALQKAKPGPDHPDTLMTMDNLAQCYADLGRHAEALKLREETLALRKAKLGADHPDTLQSMDNLAIIYQHLGRRAEALKLNEETLALRKAKLGPDHPDTLVSMNKLAASYTNVGRHAEALKLLKETLALRKAKLGPDHPDTLASMNNLAVSYALLGLYSEALKLLEETLALQKTKLGPSHPNTLGSIYNIAYLHALMIPKSPDHAKEADLAMEWLQKAVAAGYKNLEQFKKDTGLDALRGREDFKTLVAELEAKLAAEKK
jgi:tetratricopeptide (TPR) repeat protein